MDKTKDKVICSKCEKPYSDVPKVLPGCLHVFCLSCLHNLPLSYSVQESKEMKSVVFKDKPDSKESVLGESCRSTRSADSALAKSLEESISISSIMTTAAKSPILQRSKSVFESSCSMLSRNRQNSDAISFYVNCPKCDRPSSLPPCGVSGLRTDYLAMSLVGTYAAAETLQSKLSSSKCDQCVEDVPAVSYCIDCMKLICEDHSKCHNLWEEFASHKVFPLSSLPVEDKRSSKQQGAAILSHLQPSFRVGEFCCPRHLKETSDHHIRYFCTTCYDLMCGNCTVSTHKVSEHNCEFITSDYLSEKKTLAEESFDKLSGLFQDLDVVAADISSKTKSVAHHREEVKEKINELFSEIISLLEVRKKTLHNQVNEIYQDSLSRLSDCNKQVCALKNHVRECQNFVRGNLESQGDLSLLTVADLISSHTKNITSDYNKLLPNIAVTIPEVAAYPLRKADLSEAISKYASIHILPSVSSPSKKKLSLPLSLQSRVDSGLKDITCLVASDEVFSQNLQDSITGGYVYSPHRLSPSNFPPSRDDLSSPIMINIPKIAGMHVRTIEKISKPSGIRYDHRNSSIVVCVFGTHQVVTLDQHGMEIHRIGEKGDQTGRFLYPQNTAIDDQGKMLVVDSLYRIQIFDRSGKFLKSIGQKGKGQVQFNDPVAIAIGPKKKIYVLERQNQRIQVLNSNFTFHRFIGKSGRGECEFYLPNDMTIADSGHLYVADTGNHRIQILSASGAFLLAFGTKGNVPGELSHPSHLCVGTDEICISEEGNHRISIFNMKGYFMQCFGQKGCGDKEFNRPSGITIDQNRILYVCDSKNNRIEIYK